MTTLRDALVAIHDPIHGPCSRRSIHVGGEHPRHEAAEQVTPPTIPTTPYTIASHTRSRLSLETRRVDGEDRRLGTAMVHCGQAR